MPRDETIEIQDGQIVAMLRGGGEEGVRSLLRVHGPKVKWLLREHFGDVLPQPDLAAVLNETILRAFRSIGSFEETKGTLGGWLWQIARNVARSTLQVERRHMHRRLDLEPAEQGRLEAYLEDPDQAGSEQLLRDLREVIRSLPDLQRRIIRADLACGGLASAAWLARKYATSEASIYMSRSKARANLRKALRQRGHFPDEEASS